MSGVKSPNPNWTAAALLGGAAFMLPFILANLAKEKVMTSLEKAFLALTEQLCKKLNEAEQQIDKLRSDVAERVSKDTYESLRKRYEEMTAELAQRPTHEAHVEALRKVVELEGMLAKRGKKAALHDLLRAERQRCAQKARRFASESTSPEAIRAYSNIAGAIEDMS